MISVVLAILTGLLLRAYATRLAAATGREGSQASVVVASRPIARGARLAPSDVRMARVPLPYVQPGALRSLSRVVGRVALAGLSTGEAVTETRLARVRAGPVASLIPEGYRAFAVPTSLPPGSIVPGDHVDVLATFNAGQPHTERTVEGVEVLFVLQQRAGRSASADPLGIDAAAAGAQTPGTLIVIVSVEQEERLAFARAFANLEVVIAPAA